MFIIIIIIIIIIKMFIINNMKECALSSYFRQSSQKAHRVFTTSSRTTNRI